MQLMKLDAFYEGDTERNTIAQLMKRKMIASELVDRMKSDDLQPENTGEGESNLIRKLNLQLKRWFDFTPRQPASLQILVLRDLDDKNPEAIRDSTLGVIRQYAPQADFIAHATHKNVFALQNIPDLQVALHVANRKYQDDFAKATMDDYVLRLALCEKTAENLLSKSRTKAWTTTTKQLLDKIQTEIPALLIKNGIPKPDNAKAFLPFYTAVLQLKISPAVFAGKVIAHAEENDIREVFAALLAAVALLENSVSASE
jgi:hypothetical protein